jgi:hypothetical protein
LEEKMSGIPPELNNRLQRALLECGPFANDSDIKAVFVDKRIIPWRNRLPQANNPTSRVQAVVEFLHDQFSDDRENALVLLLRVLSGRVDPGDACYGRLTQLADELERELEGSNAIEGAIRMQDAQSNQLTSVHRAEAIAHIPESKGNGEQLYADVAWGGAHNSTREVLSEIPSGVHQPDGYSHYEIGLHVLLNRIELDDPHYPDALVYQQRLVENIKQSRRYGDNDTRKSERAEIVDRLNELSLSVLEVSFNKLCGTTSPFPRQEPIEADTRAISTTPSRPQVLLRPTVLLAAGIIIVAAIGVWILGTKTNLGVFDGADLSPTSPAIAASTQAPTPVPEVLASTDTQTPTPTPVPPTPTIAVASTATPPPTSTTIPTPKITETPISTITSPPSPSPVAAVATPTSVVIATSTPTPSPLSTTSPESTNIPISITVTSTPETAVPILLSPTDSDSVQTGIATTFEWQWNGKLQEGWGFEILIWKEGVDPYHPGAFDVLGIRENVQSSGNTYRFSGDVASAYSVQQHGSGEYTWTVLVVQVTPYERIGPEATSRTLNITGGGGGPGPGPPTKPPPPEP